MIDVYYAEDDESIAQAVKEYLEQQDCKVTIFRTVADVRQALKNHIPTILLVDWNMPDGQGNELCQWIRVPMEQLTSYFSDCSGRFP